MHKRKGNPLSGFPFLLQNAVSSLEWNEFSIRANATHQFYHPLFIKSRELINFYELTADRLKPMAPYLFHDSGKSLIDRSGRLFVFGSVLTGNDRNINNTAAAGFTHDG